MKQFKIVLIIGLLLSFFINSKTSQAASAVAYGTRTVHSTSNHNDITEAVKTALENCSKTDSHCVLLLKCEENGFGATFSERLEGLIISIGASCGVEDAETAKETARNNCEKNKVSNKCEMRTFWEDTAK